jgi:Ribbon-helix-helix protein, copG family
MSFAVRLDPKLLASVRRLCQKRDENISQLVRRLLREHVAAAAECDRKGR